MLCDRCGKKQASVFVKQVVNNEEKVEHLCQQCAGDLFDIGNLQLDKLFSMGGLNAPFETISTLTCPLCGTTYQQFKETGRLGCSECYDTFASRLEPLIKKMHGKSLHIGKQKFVENGNKAAAKRVVAQPQDNEDLTKMDAATQGKYYEKLALQKQLEQLIAAENFEEAVGVRDKIKALESEIQAAMKKAGEDA